MNNKTVKSNTVLTLAAILLCLVLITTHLTSGLYARYASRSSDDSSARVASFTIETDLDRVELGAAETPTLALGGTDGVQSVRLPFYISSASEVTVGYSVTVDFGSALPSYMTVGLTNGERSQTVNADGSISEFVFGDFGTMPIADGEAQRTDLILTISITDLTMITDEVSIPAAELTVRVYQVD